MEKQAKIEFLVISQENKGLKASREMLAREELTRRLFDPVYAGATVVLNFPSVTHHKALLILLADDLESIGAPDSQSARASMSPAQIIGLSLGPRLHISAGKTPGQQGAPGRENQEYKREAKQAQPPAQANGEQMTEAQRRYLFRLLAEKRALKGKDAENHLKRAFGVSSLHEIDKFSASQLIDRLVKGGDGA